MPRRVVEAGSVAFARTRTLASIAVFGATVAAVFAGCSGGGSSSGGAKDGGPTEVMTALSAATDEKSILYNLVGRWYPEHEVKRLSDRTLTPEQWCERDPTMIFVLPNEVVVTCDKGAPMSAMIAEVKKENDGSIMMLLRAKETSPLKFLQFVPKGKKVIVAGSPCFQGTTVPHARFPEYEILSREILGGRRCAQVLPQQGVEP